MATYTIDELRNLIGKIAIQYGVKKVALFGSYSAGTQTPESDIDLIIDKGDIKGLFMFNSFLHALKDTLKKDVDVVTYSSVKHSSLKDCIKKEVVLYEQQG